MNGQLDYPKIQHHTNFHASRYHRPEIQGGALRAPPHAVDRIKLPMWNRVKGQVGGRWGGGDIHVGGCRGQRGEGEKRRIGGGEGTNNF